MEAVYSQYAWLIPVFPLLAFILLISLGRQIKMYSAYISIAAALASFIMAVLVLFERVRNEGVLDYSWNGFEWLSLGSLSLNMGFEVTNLNALMLFVVTLVSLLVNVYSMGYMKEDNRITVYFS